MGVYYTLWNIILLFPEAIRLLIEVFADGLILWLLWPLDKYVIAFLLWVGRGLNYLVFGGIRFALLVIPGERKYIWDDKIGKYGAKRHIWLRDKSLSLQKCKRKDILHMKATWIMVALVYIGAILPVFHLENYISERFISRFYAVNYFFVNKEAKLTMGIENHPPFWIREDEVETFETLAEEVQREEEKEEKEPIYLKLNENTSYANIRESADIHSESICVVSNEDEIIYQDIYEYDSERIWLKVVLPYESNLEGWISANVIESEIVMELDLQY